MLTRSSHLLAFVIAFSGLSVPVAGQSLMDSLKSAYLTSPELEAARAKLHATDEGVSQALSGYRPDVSLSASAGRNYSQYRGYNSQINNPKQIGISLSQTIYDFGRTGNAVDAAEANVLKQRSSLMSTEQSVLLNAATAHADVYKSERILDLTRQNENALAQQVEATQRRFEFEENTLTDVNQSQSRLAGAVAQRIDAEGQVIAANAVYERYVGIRPGAVLAPASMERYLPLSIKDALAQGLARNPDYMQAQHAVDAAQENVDAAGAELLPYANVSIDAGRGKDRSASLREINDESASINVQLTVPLYQKGQRSSQTRAARDQLQQAKSERDRVERQISESVISAWANVATADARIASLETQVETARVALEGVRREQDAGQRSIIDILDAEQEVLNSSISLVTAQRDRSVAQFNLAVAVGMLQVREFDLDVPIYDDVEHYKEIRNQWWGTVSEVHINE